MSLQTRLAAFITAVGADIKLIKGDITYRSGPKVASFLTTAETIICQVQIPAGRLTVDTLIDIGIAYNPGSASAVTHKLYIGPLGTTSDPGVLLSTGSSNANAQRLEAIGSILSTGSGGTFNGIGTVLAGTNGSINPLAPSSNGAVNTTIANYITITSKSTTSNTAVIVAARLHVTV